MFHVTLDGVEGREVCVVSGWYAGPERGEVGRLRPEGDSAASEVGEELLFPFLWRSSGVKRPFIERLKKRGGVVAVAGDVGLAVW